jgi:hypothetical protein
MIFRADILLKVRQLKTRHPFSMTKVPYFPCLAKFLCVKYMYELEQLGKL